MSLHSESGITTASLSITSPGRATRADVTQRLLRASKRDCNDSRHRFIPRAELIDIINAELVEQLLHSIPGVSTENANHREVLQHISPGPGECSCRCGHCTGRRMILATLFLCGREDLILSFLPPADDQTCDKDLPLRFNSAGDFDYGLNAEEKDLFIHFRWHVYTPFLSGITSGTTEDFATFPEEASLPWAEKAKIGEDELGEVSYVERIEIQHLNHDLDENNVFALKTFEQRLAPGLSEARFRREAKANLDAPNHDRIVRLLTAFSHRERFYLVFPFATEGSLEKLWRNFTSDASWYSDEWLVKECLAIAEALLATHALVDDQSEGANGLLHADIKPDNILCFPESNLGEPSIVLKLADFGEAKRVKPDVGLMAGKVAHVKTYRPPEHSPGNAITLNYDVWCLGCLFLDFVTWAILGQNGIDAFVLARESEQDEDDVTESPGQIIEDTFFKRTKQESVPPMLKRIHWGRNREMKVDSGRATTTYSIWAASHVNISSRLKDVVVSHLTTLQQHGSDTDHLNRIVSFIGERMLVVDPQRRADSREVRNFLRSVLDDE